MIEIYVLFIYNITNRYELAVTNVEKYFYEIGAWLFTFSFN